MFSAFSASFHIARAIFAVSPHAEEAHSVFLHSFIQCFSPSTFSFALGWMCSSYPCSLYWEVQSWTWSLYNSNMALTRTFLTIVLLPWKYCLWLKALPVFQVIVPSFSIFSLDFSMSHSHWTCNTIWLYFSVNSSVTATSCLRLSHNSDMIYLKFKQKILILNC